MVVEAAWQATDDVARAAAIWQPISAEHVKKVLEDRLHEDVRSTILGHVQRCGSPSIYDRTLSTLTAATAVIQSRWNAANFVDDLTMADLI